MTLSSQGEPPRSLRPPGMPPAPAHRLEAAKARFFEALADAVPVVVEFLRAALEE